MQKKALLLHLNELGTIYNLSFSSEKVLGAIAIGLDGLKRKLAIFSKSGAEENFCIINLEEVECCVFKKVYRDINASELNKKKLEAFLHSIVLQFGLKNSEQPVVLPFYQFQVNNIYQLAELERKARDWHAIFSKMIRKQNRSERAETDMPVTSAFVSH